MFVRDYLANKHHKSSLKAVIWITSGIFGLLGTYFYKILVGRIGLVFTSVVGGLLHISFVFGTIGGLFTPGNSR